MPLPQKACLPILLEQSGQTGTAPRSPTLGRSRLAPQSLKCCLMDEVWQMGLLGGQ